MNSRRASSFYLFCVIIICFGIISCSQKEHSINIGAILPLTGDLAPYGENAKNGITLLAEKINNNGGIQGKNINMIFEDSNALPEKAVAAVQKLNNIDKVAAIIGDIASSPTLAIAPIVNKNKIVLVSPAASSPDISNAGPYVYRVWPSDVFEADRMADYVKTFPNKKIAVLYVNNDYGQAMLKEFKTRLMNSAIDIIAEEKFEQNTIDVRIQITRIKKTNPDFIYLISYPKDSIIILRQYKELALSVRLLSTSSFEDNLILKEVGGIAEGVIFTSPIPPQEDDLIVSSFKTDYKNRFGAEPGLVADFGYDALLVMLEAIKLSGKLTRDGIKEGIDLIKNLNGATGVINFDKNGDVVKPSGLKTVKSGKYVWLKR